MRSAPRIICPFASRRGARLLLLARVLVFLNYDRCGARSARPPFASVARPRRSPNLGSSLLAPRRLSPPLACWASARVCSGSCAGLWLFCRFAAPFGGSANLLSATLRLVGFPPFAYYRLRSKESTRINALARFASLTFFSLRRQTQLSGLSLPIFSVEKIFFKKRVDQYIDRCYN